MSTAQLAAAEAARNSRNSGSAAIAQSEASLAIAYALLEVADAIRQAGAEVVQNERDAR